MSWRILVADDDREIGTLIATILRKGPHTVTICSDAESALVELGRGGAGYDLLVTDFTLPGRSGIELIAAVRATPATAAMPIVMISAHGSEAMDARAKTAGADAFLNKPFTVSQLRTTVRMLLDPLHAAGRG
ncbi:MAG: response regulator [Candidatus Eremiobacteraeota bacterium]|nr:response regulator [Candidatus Eremiobacteraeota bacterium]